MGNTYAATGSASSVALRSLTTEGIFALDVEGRLTELKRVLEQRKLKALMPYNPEAWEKELNAAGLLNRYPHIPEGLRQGFHLDIPNVRCTQVPDNKESIVTYQQEFDFIVQTEIKKGRYIGPFKADELER
jgi:hypothetical protein